MLERYMFKMQTWHLKCLPGFNTQHRMRTWDETPVWSTDAQVYSYLTKIVKNSWMVSMILRFTLHLQGSDLILDNPVTLQTFDQIEEATVFSKLYLLFSPPVFFHTVFFKLYFSNCFFLLQNVFFKLYCFKLFFQTVSF